jgi:hypothetical protein
VLFSDNASENHHSVTNKTVKTPGASSRRRAFGDISNRKVTSNQAKVTVQKRGVAFAVSSKKSTSKSIVPTRTSTPYVETTILTTPSISSQREVPMEDVEFPAGRPFNPLDGEDDDLNLSLDFGSPVPMNTYTPRLWMRQLDFEVTHGLNDDASLMTAPDELLDPGLCRIDLSLEEEVDALGIVMNDFLL